MKKIYAFLPFALFLFFSGCSSMEKLPPQPTIAAVEIPRFMGRWFVIASIPTMFEEGAHNATETYTWNQAEERIDIDFRYNKGSFAGPEKSIPQKAFIYNHDTNAEWRVQPFWPLKFAYLIVDLAPDSSDCMIGVPDRKNLWIMSRERHIPGARYLAIIRRAKALGYDTSAIKSVPQQP